jgi:two-component system NtrC family sensor kinase
VPTPAARPAATAISSRRRNYRPRRSLRTILLIWFLLLSLVPLMFVTGYSLVKYEEAIDSELVQRLRANSREVATTISEYERYLSSRRDRLRNDPKLQFHLSVGSAAAVRQMTSGILANSFVSEISVFDRDYQRISVLSQADLQVGREAINPEPQLALHEAFTQKLGQQHQIVVASVGPQNSLDLISIVRIDGKNGSPVGAVEEVINLGGAFLENLKKRLGLEILVFDSRGDLVAASHPDLLLFPKDYFHGNVQALASGGQSLFDLALRGEPLGFMLTKIQWGDSNFSIGLGASKRKAKAVLRNINLAFFTVIGAVGLLLILTAFVTSRIVLRPLNDLVEALRSMELEDGPIEIPVTTETEIGVLTESFNEMSHRIHLARQELKTKIEELEAANREIRDTQARLVHTAKMASLGQLVAGVAHELNNPIGFVYSNMATLRDYSHRLVHLIELAEKNPKALESEKAKADYEFVQADLPKLIASCEDGARRMKEIVVKLRNFSRLDEAKLKKVNLREGLESTLALLHGELKNRIEVEAEYAEVPEVTCYASQINQVFMNILSNGAQAIEGEGKIRIQLDQPDAQHVRVRISDSGRGMDRETIERIFDPFFTTKDVGQGTGLGLSISYGIIKKHGGEIQVTSSPGQGSEFTILVPIESALPAGS